jgi:hypothetical protein
VKTALLAVAFVLTLSLAAVAANSNKAEASLHKAGNPSATEPQFKNTPNPLPPALCHPCLFYGGDLNPNDVNAAGLSDENTLLIPGSSTYGAVDIPAGITAKVFGILFNVQASAAFDPMTASYDIRTGVSERNGGVSIASGSGTVVVQATGRNFLGLNEYTIAVSWSTPVTLTSGTYWFNMTPTCTNTLDGSCVVFRQLVSNTTSLTHNVRGSWQPIHQMFVNSPFFGYTWLNWCDSALGLNGIQCAGMSFGLRGTK